MRKLIYAGMIVAGMTAGVLAAPAAHADANTQFEVCLNNHGYTITNEQVALTWGEAIQNDLRRGYSPVQIRYNLVNNGGFDYDKASVYVQCVAATELQLN